MKKTINFISFTALSMFCFHGFAQETTQEADTIEPSLKCEYLITNEWNTGYTGVVQLTNTVEADVVGWSVNWVLNNNILSNTWNAQIESTELEDGSVQYVASHLDWNETIEFEETIEFGFQGEKLDSQIDEVDLFGEKCLSIEMSQDK